MRNRPGDAGAVEGAKVRGNRREEARLGNCDCSLSLCSTKLAFSSFSGYLATDSENPWHPVLTASLCFSSVASEMGGCP